MSTPFASGKHAIAECDRCGQRYKLKELKKEVVKQRITGLLVCPTCWDPDHPQLMLGTFPVYDPQALRDPRPDHPASSRNIYWGWNPVGGGNYTIDPDTPNPLVFSSLTGTVSVTV